MTKLYFISLILIIISVIFTVALTFETYGDMNPDTIKTLAIFTGLSLFGGVTCRLIDVMIKSKIK